MSLTLLVDQDCVKATLVGKCLLVPHQKAFLWCMVGVPLNSRYKNVISVAHGPNAPQKLQDSVAPTPSACAIQVFCGAPNYHAPQIFFSNFKKKWWPPKVAMVHVDMAVGCLVGGGGSVGVTEGGGGDSPELVEEEEVAGVGGGVDEEEKVAGVGGGGGEGHRKFAGVGHRRRRRR